MAAQRAAIEENAPELIPFFDLMVEHTRELEKVPA